MFSLLTPSASYVIEPNLLDRSNWTDHFSTGQRGGKNIVYGIKNFPGQLATAGKTGLRKVSRRFVNNVSLTIQESTKGGFAMKKIFVAATAVISTLLLMLSIGVNFAQAAEQMMDKDKEVMTKSCEMVREKGQMMMDTGKMMKECSVEDKATSMKEGEKMTKQGSLMMKEGDTMMKNGEMMTKNGTMMMKNGKMMMEGKMDKAMLMRESEMMMKEGKMMKEKGQNGITDFSGQTNETR